MRVSTIRLRVGDCIGSVPVFVAERRLNLARPFKAGEEIAPTPGRRVATVDISRRYATRGMIVDRDPGVETPG
jgi:hypothetical protein